MMQPGNYYVGDLCYVMNDVWEEVCELIISGNRMLAGEFTLKDGRKFAMFNTAWGDGGYYDQFGREYSVDSGTIGCILAESIKSSEENSLEGGQIIEFNHAFTTYREDGEIVFDRIRIDTDPTYNSLDDEEEE